jgi:hypothetical protein
LAGGNWDTYRAMLLEWSNTHPQLQVYILKLE